MEETKAKEVEVRTYSESEMAAAKVAHEYWYMKHLEASLMCRAVVNSCGGSVTIGFHDMAEAQRYSFCKQYDTDTHAITFRLIKKLE